MSEEQTRMIGRLLSANSSECVVSYVTGENEVPSFGAMVRMPLNGSDIEIFGIVADVKLEEDGFLRQIAGAPKLDNEVILDAQQNRNVPIVLRVLFLGYREEDRMIHMLPPRPPLTLTEIFRCTETEVVQFTKKLGYLRLILNVQNVRPAELLAVHIHYAAKAHLDRGDTAWAEDALRELMYLMMDDYEGLTSVLAAVGDTDIFA